MPPKRKPAPVRRRKASPDEDEDPENYSNPDVEAENEDEEAVAEEEVNVYRGGPAGRQYPVGEADAREESDHQKRIRLEGERDEEFVFGTVVEDDGDVAMDDDDPDDFRDNDSIAHMDLHLDSVFCVAQHPIDTSLVATGSGDDFAIVFSAALPNAVQPPSEPESDLFRSRSCLPIITRLGGHTDTVNCLAWSLPDGRYVITGGMEGKCQVFDSRNNYKIVGVVQEVSEVNFLIPCPHPSWPNTFALGGGDGSIWFYTIDADDASAPLQQVQYYGMHRAFITAGVWSADGSLLASADEDGHFFVFDVFGDAAAQEILPPISHTALVTFDNVDARSQISGGIFSLDIHKTQPWLAVGGGHGMIRIMQIPRLLSKSELDAVEKSKRGGGGKARPGWETAKTSGDVLHTMHVFKDSVETVSFDATGNFLAACSTDGSIAIFACNANFTLRRHIKKAHDGVTVVKIEWCRAKGKETQLVSCGLDGAIRRWDVGGQTAQAKNQGMINEWHGHEGEKEREGEGGGVMGFVVSERDNRIVSVGDDGKVLVFDADKPL